MSHEAASVETCSKILSSNDGCVQTSAIVSNSTRSFAWLLSASASANLSDGISLAFIPLVASGLAVSATQVSWIDGSRQLPLLVLALPAGVLLDRIDRRSCIIVVNVLRGAVLLWLAWLLGSERLTVGVIAAFAAVIGSLEAINDVAMPTVLPEVVEAKNLTKANGLMSSVETMTNYFIGRSLGSGIAAFASYGAAAALSGVLYLLAAALWFPIQRVAATPQTTTRRSLRKELNDGVTYVWRHQTLRPLAIMGAFGNFAFGGIFATLVLYVTRELSAPASLFGILQGAFAIGSIFVGWQVSRIIIKVGEWRALMWSVCLIPLAFAMTPLVPHVATVALTSLVNGAAAVVWNTVSISYRQRTTPQDLLGRATAVFRLVSWGGMPLGAIASGPIADRWGFSAVYFLFAAIAALNVPIAFRLMRKFDE